MGRERRKLPRKHDVTECIILASVGRSVVTIVVSTTRVKIWSLDSVILNICGWLRFVLVLKFTVLPIACGMPVICMMHDG